MQRVTWTDERLDDRFDGLDRTLDRINRDILDLRSEMRAGFADVRSEINGVRGLIFRTNAGLLIAVLAAVFLHGV